MNREDLSTAISLGSGAGEALAPPQAASLAAADEIFLRCAPALTGTEHRFTAAAVIDRDKMDLIAVLQHLADCMDANSTVNRRTGGLQTLVDPEWFGKFNRALERHTGRS